MCSSLAVPCFFLKSNEMDFTLTIFIMQASNSIKLEVNSIYYIILCQILSFMTSSMLG